VIRQVRIEPTLHGPDGYPHRLAPGRNLDRFEVERVGRPWTDQCLDLRDDLTLKDLFEAPFLAVAFASAICFASCHRFSSSLVSANSSASFQNL
jgi:hypothetical protein